VFTVDAGGKGGGEGESESGEGEGGGATTLFVGTCDSVFAMSEAEDDDGDPLFQEYFQNAFIME
jgi:hypothetical protein